MTRKRSPRSGSWFTLCLVFVLSIAFLAPLYHNHDHADDYHHENSGLALLHDGSDHDGLSENEQRNDSHLHIKKDIGRTGTHLRLKSSSDLHAETGSPAFAEPLSHAHAKEARARIFQSIFYDCPSGLSPPAA
jgi:hypothetical protein